MSNLNQNIQQALTDTISQLLNTMIPMHFNVESQSTESFAEKSSSYLLGNIKVQGQLMGSLSVSIPHELALDMTARMLDEPIEDIGDDVYETVAEIINIVAGGVKSALSAENELFELGLPQVVELDQAPAHLLDNPFRLYVPVNTESGYFMLFSTLHETQ